MKLPLPLTALMIGLALPKLAMAEQCHQPVLVNGADYAVAVAKQKTYFRDENGKHSASYILHGDEVVVMSQQGTMACVDFATRRGDTSGWLPLIDLGPLQKPVLTSADWNGQYQRDVLGSYVELKPQSGNTVSAKGEAYWASSLELAKKGGLNLGEVDDQGKLDNGIVHIGAPEKDGTDCSIDLRLLSKRYLVVAKHTADDGSLVCWGHKVTFDGLYVKVKK